MSNPDLPWFPWYVRDALSDARWQSMPAIARGCFVQLLMYQWENGSLDPDRTRLIHLAAITDIDVEAIGMGRPEIFTKFVWAFLEELFPKWRDGRLRNQKLHRVRDAKLRQLLIARESGRRGGAKRETTSSASKREKREGRRGKRGKTEDDPLFPLSTNHSGGTTSQGCLEAPLRDADADADAEKKREEDVDGKPPTLAPPVPDPRPPFRPVADDGRPVHGPSRIRWDEFSKRWNALAAAEDLPRVDSLSDARKRKARKIAGAFHNRGLDWFGELEQAVRAKRGDWARGMRFPNLDQALREEIVDKLREGFYERDRQSSSSQPEHLNRQSDFKPTRGPTRVKIIRPEDRR